MSLLNIFQHKKKKKKKKQPITPLFGNFSMNKRAVARGPSLSFFMIGIIVFVGVIMLVYSPNWGIYNNFMQANNGSIDSNYASAYNNITSSVNDINSFGKDVTMKSFQSILQEAPGQILNTFAIGFSAIRTFTQLPDFFSKIMSTVSTVLHIPDPILWMVTSIVAIFVAAKFIKSMRGVVDDI